MHTSSSTRYDTMQYRRVGRTGLQLPAISLGLWHNFGAVDNLENCRAMLRRAFDLGITHFDLANNYGPPAGSAEANFGRLFSEDFLAHRDEIVISTKAGYRMWPGPYGEWGSRKSLISSLDQSLKRMQLDYVDIFYSHRFDPNTPLEETMGALDYAVRSGRAMYVGISSYGVSQTLEAARILRALGTPCVIHQPIFNMFNRWVETEGLLDTLQAEGIGCIPFSPLAQGLLTDKYLCGIPADSRAASVHGFLQAHEVSPNKIAQVAQLNDMAKQRGQTLAQLALAWVLRHNQVSSVLIGASRVAQIEDAVGLLANSHFTQAELAAIDAVLR